MWVFFGGGRGSSAFGAIKNKNCFNVEG